MVFTVQNKKNVLMLGLFAVVGFNVSLNPESIEVRRTIASQAKAEGKFEFASELDSIPLLNVELGKILSEITRKDENLSVTREAKVVRSGTGADQKIDYVQVEFKVVNPRSETEAQNPAAFNCRTCQGWHSVKLDAGVWDKDPEVFKRNVDQKLAKTLDQMREKDGDRETVRGRPTMVKAPLNRDDCHQDDLGLRLECKGDKLNEVLDKCDIDRHSAEKDRKDCNQLIVFYRENLAEPLMQGLKSESAETRRSAASIRTKILNVLPRTTESGNNIRAQLVEQSKIGLQNTAQRVFDEAMKDAKAKNYSPQDQRRFADTAVQSFFSSEKSGFGDLSAAGDGLNTKFNSEMAQWRPKVSGITGPQMPGQGQATNPALAGNRQFRGNVTPCQGSSCPPAGPTAFFGSPNQTGQQPRVPVPYSPVNPRYYGQGAPGSAWRPN